MATGASTLKETINATRLILKYNKKLVLMQCNTNYTNDKNNLNFINLLALKTFKKIFKDKIILGLSDHTEGHATVLGSIALGARVIEKHFTDNNNRKGPDHKFSMNPKSWKDMIKNSRELEKSLGNGTKKLELNEKKSVIVQRRGVWTKKDLKKGTKLQIKDLNFLRPCPKNSISPFEISKFIGKKIKKNLKKNSLITLNCLK